MPKRTQEVIIISDSDSDRPLRKKPALSTNQSTKPKVNADAKTGAKANADTNEDQDEELRLAIELSLQGQIQAAPETKDTALSRAQLEQERLARQKAREKETNRNPESSPPIRMETKAINSTRTNNNVEANYWNGKIVHCHNQISSTFAENSLSIPQLLGPQRTIKVVLISSFATEIEWIASQLTGEYPVLLIMQPGAMGFFGSRKESVMVLDSEVRKNTFAVFPTMKTMFPGHVGAMHVKLFIIYHETFCRIVIPTANCMEHDWQSVDNLMYIQDFPAKETPPSLLKTPLLNPTATQFTTDLLTFLQTLGSQNRFLNPLSRYDFRMSESVQLVVSKQGTLFGWENIQSSGISALANAVQKLKFSKGGTWHVEYTCSSLGKMPDRWLKQFMAACFGIPPSTYFSSKTQSPPNSDGEMNLKIIYPTLSEIDSSKHGRPGAGTLFFQESNWKDPKWGGRNYLCQGRSRRRGTVAHTKMIVALHKPSVSLGSREEKEEIEHEGWIYVGSHNFTPSAWGTLSMHSSGQPKLTTSNYELGLIFKFTASTAQDLEKQANNLASYIRPLERYKSTHVPWMQNTHKEN